VTLETHNRDISCFPWWTRLYRFPTHTDRIHTILRVALVG